MFVALGSVTVVGAVLVSLVGRSPGRGPPRLGAASSWPRNNATIMMVVLLLLGLKVLGDALGGL